MESLFNSSFVLGFGLDESMFKPLPYLTLNQNSEILFPALLRLCSAFSSTTFPLLCLIFLPTLTAMQTLSTHKTSENTAIQAVRYWDAVIHCRTLPVLTSWADLEVNMATAGTECSEQLSYLHK